MGQRHAPDASAAASASGYKWDLGWMHDTLAYLARDPIHRKLSPRRAHVPRRSTRTAENFVLPLSHDEVVHGKGSLLAKMPGDRGRSSRRCGCSTATSGRCPARSCCSWAASSASGASGTTTRARLAPARTIRRTGRSQRWSAISTGVSQRSGAARRSTASRAAFTGSSRRRRAQRAGVRARRGERRARIVCALNFTPVPRPTYRVGVGAPGCGTRSSTPTRGELGGSGRRQPRRGRGGAGAAHGRPLSLSLTVPPLGAVWLRR